MTQFFLPSLFIYCSILSIFFTKTIFTTSFLYKLILRITILLLNLNQNDGLSFDYLLKNQHVLINSMSIFLSQYQPIIKITFEYVRKTLDKDYFFIIIIQISFHIVKVKFYSISFLFRSNLKIYLQTSMD